ncbi:hypothetical protein GCM10008018_24320 [Paenibacillus marchantiophytorum]|uniref:Flagellin Flp1-like domain-containing protein n=1 Tax=Paenibacillus marchantiophytorum TaxID=1619310 RepID=A0ABQ1ELW7_9BACL|nr:hypothetical protein GCM10008018_24320 [Paenibacillus marchantiophytorum]
MTPTIEFIETGLKLFVFIIAISLFFKLVGFLVKYISDFFQGFSRIIIKIFGSIRSNR